MGAATCAIYGGTGSSVSWANVESGCKFNLNDDYTSTTPIQVPTSTGTNYSWIKNMVLYVSATGTTNITNRTVKLGSSPATGLKLHFKTVAVASYAQSASGNRPSSSGSDGATPSGYTAMTTSAQQYDNTSVATSSTGPNGDMCVVVAGIDSTYASGPGNNNAVPNIVFNYDEA